MRPPSFFALFFFPFCLSFFILQGHAQKALPANDVALGKCIVRGQIEAPQGDIARIDLHWNDFYTEMPRTQTLQIDAEGGIADEIEIDTRYALAMMVVQTRASTEERMLLLSQNDTLRIRLGQALSIEGSIAAPLVGDRLLLDYLPEWSMLGPKQIAPGLSALQHKRWVEEELLPATLDKFSKILPADISTCDKAFLENWGKMNFFNTQLLRAVGDSSQVDPSYFSFLNRLELKPQLAYYNLGLGSFLSWLSSSPSLRIPSIGETPIAAWETQLRQCLARIPFAPTDFFCHLMAFHSYMEQLNDAEKLTPQQVQNIVEGMPQNWRDLLLRYQREAEKEPANHTLEDTLSTIYPSLESLLKDFKGAPVVVELWYSACPPCVGLQKIMAQTVELPRYASIPLLSLSSPELSPPGEWRKRVKHLKGHHYLVSDNLLRGIIERHKLRGYPSLLFYDREHRLLEVKTGIISQSALQAAFDSVIAPPAPTQQTKH